jgi:hypothetical protein
MRLPVASATVIEVGDLVWYENGELKPAAARADAGTEAANQEAFHDRFAGVAMQRSPAGESEPVRVATTGVFEFDCPSGTYEPGQLLGVKEAANGTQLENQRVASVAGAALAVGRCARRVNPAGTSVLVSVVGTVLHGGPQAVV